MLNLSADCELEKASPLRRFSINKTRDRVVIFNDFKWVNSCFIAIAVEGLMDKWGM